MTRKTVQKIIKGITDKIECNTADIDDWAEFWGFTREEYEEFLDMPFKALKQEPKPMVEIDLDYVIKQKYIERDVLDKIRAEIETKYGQCDICEYFEDYDYEENDISEYRPIGNIADILQILGKYIDKYKADKE